jgi:hypothetical protein
VVHLMQRAQQELIHGLQINLLAWDQVELFLEHRMRHLTSLVRMGFRYIDKVRIDALYNQMEPDILASLNLSDIS